MSQNETRREQARRLINRHKKSLSLLQLVERGYVITDDMFSFGLVSEEDKAYKEIAAKGYALAEKLFPKGFSVEENDERSGD